MESLLSIAVGVLFGTGVYLMLRRNLIKFIFGFILMGNGINLLIFTVGRLTRGTPPIVPEDSEYLDGAVITNFANPLPQALILTAIVIGFGFVAFSLVLLYRTYTVEKTLDTDKLQEAVLPEVIP